MRGRKHPDRRPATTPPVHKPADMVPPARRSSVGVYTTSYLLLIGGGLWAYQWLLANIEDRGNVWIFDKDAALPFGAMIVALAMSIFGMYMLVRVYDAFPKIDLSKTAKENGIPGILQYWQPIIKDIQDDRSRTEGLILAFISYIVIISVFAIMYWFLDATDGTCFSKPKDVPLDGLTAFYFSVVTSATVGYGDIYATCSTSRIVVVAEIFVALIYAVFLFSIAVDSTRRH